MRVRPIRIWKLRKLERDRIWFGTMKCPASASASTETARNRSSSSIAVTTDNASSGSGQAQDGHLGGARRWAKELRSAVDQGHDPEFYNSERQKINPVESFIQLIAEEAKQSEP
jgi:hypothetical protein